MTSDLERNVGKTVFLGRAPAHDVSASFEDFKSLLGSKVWRSLGFFVQDPEHAWFVDHDGLGPIFKNGRQQSRAASSSVGDESQIELFRFH